MNLLEFFNQMGKAGGGVGTLNGGGGGGAAKRSNGLSSAAAAAATTSLNGSVLDRVTVKEEPLSEEDLRALQKDRQKKDNHNMSEKKTSRNLMLF